MPGPEGRPPNVSPARKGWEVDPENGPSAVGAALNRPSALPVSFRAANCLRQVMVAMNELRGQLFIATIKPNGSAALPFVIPSAAEGSAVLLISIEAGRKPRLPIRHLRG